MARFFPLRNALTRKVRTSLTPETRNEEDGSHKDLQDEPPSHAEEVLSNAQVITWSCVLTWEASFITLGNLFTIITFTFIKKLRPKKSLYLVINMAFADLLLGSVSTYIYFYPCNLRTVIAGKISRFSQNDYCCFRAGLFYFCCFDIC